MFVCLEALCNYSSGCCPSSSLCSSLTTMSSHTLTSVEDMMVDAAPHAPASAASEDGTAMDEDTPASCCPAGGATGGASGSGTAAGAHHERLLQQLQGARGAQGGAPLTPRSMGRAYKMLE